MLPFDSDSTQVSGSEHTQWFWKWSSLRRASQSWFDKISSHGTPVPGAAGRRSAEQLCLAASSAPVRASTGVRVISSISGQWKLISLASLSCCLVPFWWNIQYCLRLCVVFAVLVTLGIWMRTKVCRLLRYALKKKTILFGNLSQTSDPPQPPLLGTPYPKKFFSVYFAF